MGNKWVVIWQLVGEKQLFFVRPGVVPVVMVIAQSDLGIVLTTNEVVGCVSRCNISSVERVGYGGEERLARYREGRPHRDSKLGGGKGE